MSASAGVSRIDLEPLVTGLAMDTTGLKHSTANPYRCRLGSVSELLYKRGSGVFKLKLSSAPTTGTVTVRFQLGTKILASKVLDLSGGSIEYMDTLDISLAGAEGTQEVLAQVEVDAAADGGITADFHAGVNIEIPLVAGC